MFGPTVVLNAAKTNPSSTIGRYPSAMNSPIAAPAAPSAPTCSVVRRPSVVSATCPQTGFATMRAAAIAAITIPICAAESPRADRNSARNGKNAAIVMPNNTKSTWTATAGRNSGRGRVSIGRNRSSATWGDRALTGETAAHDDDLERGPVSQEMTLAGVGEPEALVEVD